MTRTLWRKLWRDIRANRGQTAALVLLIALGIASFMAMIGAYRDLSLSYEHTYEQLKFADLTIKVLGAPQTVVDEIAQIEGVQAAMGRYVVDTGYDAGETTLRARLIGIPDEHRPAVNDLLLLEGRYFEPGETGVALLEKHFAEAHNIHPNDTITPILNGQSVPLKVVGIVASPEYLIVSPSRYELIPANRTFAVIFTPLNDLQRRLEVGQTINEIAVRIDDNADLAAVEQRLREHLAPYGLVESITRDEQPSHAALQLDIDGFRQMAYAIPVLMLFVALMALSMLVGRLVHTQRPLIGVMLAFGHTRQTVLRFFLLLALTIGVLGAAAGIALGVPLGTALTSAYAHELGIPLVKTRPHPDAMLLAVALSLLTATLAALSPARRATQVEPATAMRQDPALSVVAVR
ncbi:MAG: ABC transporter permease, partial [Ardenticatenia bacterium]